MTSPRNWSTEAYLSLALLGLLICLSGLLYVHHHYTLAQTAYESHSVRIVLTPDGHALKELNQLAATADRWWRWQLLLSVLTLGALAGVVVLVLRRRNERLAVEADGKAAPGPTESE
jgi:hypothetical protein